MIHPIDQARNYLAKADPAIAGAGGHNATYHVAAALIEGFNLSIADARILLTEYSQRCQPPWSEQEIEHKLADAERKKDPAKVGSRLRNGVKWKMGNAHSNQVHSHPKPAQSSSVVPGHYELPDSLELPEPLADATRTLLRTAFRPGEYIGISLARDGDDGREVPRDSGATLTREKWLEKLDTAKGDPNLFLCSSERNGIFIRINPLTDGGSKDGDVTAFRHALLEFDSMDQTEQYGYVQVSLLPCAAVILSGNKSVHAWVKVGASSREEYDARVKLIFDHFADYKPDGKNKNPSRFSRLPGCERGLSRQELIAVNIGKATFEEWQEHIRDKSNDLPAIENTEIERNADHEPLRELIAGVLHQSCKCILGGSSKARKTWILIDMALSISAGIPFLKWPTQQGRVLYINFEVHKQFFHWRLNKIAEARGITDTSQLDHWPLRGYAAPMWKLLPEMEARIGSGKYCLITIDPVYKTLGGRDENAAGQVGELCNEIERLAVRTGAAVVFGAHYSKGNAAAKEAMDRIGGSGVFGRDADAIITMTRHKSEGAYTVDLTLRNHPEQPPFVVVWDMPVLRIADNLDARDLAQARGRSEEYTAKDLFELLTNDGLLSSEWLTRAEAEHSMSRATFNRLRKELLAGTTVDGKKMRVIKQVSDGKYVVVKIQ